MIGLDFKKDSMLEKIELSTFFREVNLSEMSREEDKLFKFITCGDLRGFD